MEIRRGWTRQVAATALLVVVCGAAGTLVACGDSTGPGVNGDYALTTVDGHALPATVPWGVSETTFGAGSLALRSAGTFSLVATSQGGQPLIGREGSWKSSGARVVLTYAITPGPGVCPQPLPNDTAAISGSTLTFTSHWLPSCTGGATFTFTR